MAHELSTINGRISMAYQGETPWHKLGERMDSLADVPAALAAANLNWTVSLATMYRAGKASAGDDSAYVPVTDRKAVMRDVDGAYLGSVGPMFRPIQNADAFGILQDACTEHGVTIESAGALGNGARTWMLAKLPTDLEPVPGDVVRGYFMVVNGHDGSTAHFARPTPIRVVCANTLAVALSDGIDMVRIRHTVNGDQRLREAKRMIHSLIGAMKATGDSFRQLADKRMTPADVAAYIETVFPADADGRISDVLKARRHNVAGLVWCGKGAELAGADSTGATAWGAFNAVAEYLDHVRPAEAATAAGAARANESAIFGASAAVKVLAMKTARQLVAA